MIFQVIVHEQAERDIRRNRNWWTENHSVEEANLWANFMFDAFEDLEIFPALHRLAQENDEHPYELREMLFGLDNSQSHRAIFRVNSGDVHVLRVVRVSQDRVEPQNLSENL